MPEKICCCSSIVAMGINISVQFLLSVAGLASAGLVLNKNWLWNLMNLEVDHVVDHQGIASVPSQAIITTATAVNYSVTAPAITWFDAWLELGMTFYIGFAAVWIMTLFIASLSFRYYRPILIIPNIVILILGVLLNGIAFGAILAKNLNMSPYGSITASDYQQVILLYIMALFMLVFVFTFLFIFLSIRYYHFMVRRLDSLSNTATKKIVQTTTPSSVSTGVEYSKT